MAVTEATRHRLYQRLEDVLGDEEATTLMEHLPGLGWAEVATKQDVAHETTVLRGEMGQNTAQLRHELGETSASQRHELTQATSQLHHDMGQLNAKIDAVAGQLATKADNARLDTMAEQLSARIDGTADSLRAELHKEFSRSLAANFMMCVTMAGVIITAVQFMLR